MSKVCETCGEEILFRHIRGRVVPLNCRCRQESTPITTAREDSTFKTTCPMCHSTQVYFIRHNGGCLWVDALGDPWPKHGCFPDDPEHSITARFPGVRTTGVGTTRRLQSSDWRSRPEFYATTTSHTGRFLVLDSAGELPSDGDLVALSSSPGATRLHTSSGAVHTISFFSEPKREWNLNREWNPNRNLREAFTTCPVCNKRFHWTEYEAHKLRHRNGS
jgi:hypothetical protein